MSLQLYVGNFPSHFLAEDLEDLFSEFEGIKIDKFFKKNHKCFAFLSCVDIEQIVSVIEKKNQFVAGGRNIVVRASNLELQNYIDILLHEKNDLNPRKTVHNDYPDIKENKSTPEISKHRFATTRKSPTYSNSELSCSNISEESFDDSLPVRVVKNRRKFEDYQQMSGKENSFVDTCDSSDINKRDLGYSSSCIEQQVDDAASNLSDPYGDAENCVWVSVTNFPIGTSETALLDLFADYDPVDILMICNEPRQDRTLTEAFISFLNKEIADDVIMSFDNTIFRRRLLLVNDIEDLTMMKELLDVNK